MESKQLRYFVKVYEARHLSRAAELSNISQSAVSFHISNLEAEFGTRLFVRDAKGMQPTAAGELLYRHAVPLLRGLVAAADNMRHLQGELSGDFAIGLAYSVLKAIGSQLMRTMLDDYPKVRLSLTESIPSTTLLHVMQTELDLALTFNPPPHPELNRWPILTESLVCIGRRDIVGDTSEPISMDDLLTRPLIMFRQFGGASPETSLLREINARARLRMNSFQAIGDALRVGHGCFIGSKLYARELLESGAVAMRRIRDEPLTRTLCVIELAERPATFLGEMMRQLLIQLLREAVEAGEWEATLFAPDVEEIHVAGASS